MPENEIIDEAGKEKMLEAAAQGRKMSIILTHPEGDLTISGIRAECLKALSYAEARVILSDTDAKVAVEDLSVVSKLKKSLEEQRKIYLDPINQHLGS